MKKLIALLLALVMVGAMFTACGGDKENEKDTDKGGQTVNTDKTPIADNMETTVNAIIEKNPVEFMGGLMPVDLTDTSEDGLWAIKSFTGLDSAEGLKDIAEQALRRNPRLCHQARKRKSSARVCREFQFPAPAL